jgi:pimeloyl-ACP methyl ester carboxylesterase
VLSVIASILLTGALLADEEIVVVPVRPDGDVRMLLTRPAAAPKAIVLFFPGGDGSLAGPSGRFYGPFRRELAALGYLAAVVDTPSIHASQDVRPLIDRLHANLQLRVYLMGHSNGAVVAARVAATLPDPRIAGIALLSSPFVPSEGLERVNIPVVIAHHERDRCPSPTFAAARGYAARFKASPRAGFIAVSGGRIEGDDPCRGSNHHSFFGQRQPVMEAVMRWLDGEDIRRVDGTTIN